MDENTNSEHCYITIWDCDKKCEVELEPVYKNEWGENYLDELISDVKNFVSDYSIVREKEKE